MWYKAAQTGKLQPSLFFDPWAEGHKVIEDDFGNPRPLYHGTTHEFKKFDPKKSGERNFFGKGLYFTNDTQDLNNYSGMGPDLTNRIRALTEEIESKILNGDYDTDKIKYSDLPDNQVGELAKEWAIKSAKGSHEGASIPVFLKAKNWANLNSKDPQWIGPVFSWDNKSGLTMFGRRFRNALWKAGDQLDIDINDTQKIWDNLTTVDELFDSITLHKLYKLFSEAAEYIENYETGDYIGSGEIFAAVLRALKYDGIIANAYDHFPYMEKVNPDTRHYVVWNPSHVKSSIGNSGLYDPRSKDITQ